MKNKSLIYWGGVVFVILSLGLGQKTKAETIPNPPSGSLNLNKVFSTNTIQGNGGLINGDMALKITDNTNQKSSIWSKKKLDFSKKFTIKSFMYFGNRGGDAADGITLSFQDKGQAVIGDSGQNLGAYGGGLGTNALSLEFDTYYNGFQIFPPGNDGLIEKPSNSFQGQHVAFINHSLVFPHNGLSYIYKEPNSGGYAYLPNGLSDGSWKRLTLTWEPTTNTMSYELGSTLKNTSPYAKGSYTIDPTRFANKQAYWGYTGSTGASWASNAVAFQGVPQAQTQELALSKASILEGDETTLTIDHTTVSGSWSNRKVVIDWSNLGVGSVEYVANSLSVDGKSLAPQIDASNGKITINNLSTLSSDGTDTSRIQLKLKGLQISDLKNIKVQGYGTNEYDDDFPKENEVGLEIKQAPITAEPNAQSFLLGASVSGVDPKALVKNVKINGSITNSYTAQYVSQLSSDIVGTQNTQVKVIAYNGKTKYETTVDVPVTVNWGNALQIKGNNYETIMGLALLNENNQLKLVAASGETNTGSIYASKTNTYLTVSKFTDISLPLNNASPNFSKSFSGTQTKATAREQIGTLTTNTGEILGVEHQEALQWNEMLSLYSNSVKSIPYKDNSLTSNTTYYEITASGYQLLFLNQLGTKTATVPIYTNKSYFDQHVSEYIDLKGHSKISVKGFSKYPDTTSPGQKSGKVIVEEPLSNGKKAQFEYEITFTVGEGSLSFSAPNTMDFKAFTKSRSEQLIQRTKTENLGISIKDDRGSGKQGDWSLNAQIKNNQSGIAPYLIYRNKEGGDSYLNSSSVQIYHHDKQTSATAPIDLDISSQWNSSVGLFLKIPSKNGLLNQKYSTTITWNLVEGP